MSGTQKRYRSASTLEEKRRRGMIGLGLGLGLVPVLFLGIYVWAQFDDSPPDWAGPAILIVVLAVAVAGEYFAGRK